MCKYCEGKLKLYQETNSMKLYINTLGKAKALLVDSDNCPPKAMCAMKGISNRGAFIINYCPNCGRKLSESNMEE